MKNNIEICPFSKPILGRWCQCEHSKLADRCSGKLSCTRKDDLKESCLELDEAFKINTRFILGVIDSDTELTHAQLMKIRCGGLLGMKKVLKLDNDELVNVRTVISNIESLYGKIDDFPYSEIVKDIKLFKHRK